MDASLFCFSNTTIARTKSTSGNTGISIPDLATIFDDPNVIMDVVDERHSLYEKRYYAYGWTSTGFYVLVWYTYREDTIRIIGGRKLK